MKQGYILMFTLILLMFIAALLSGLTFLARTSIPLEHQFYKKQQTLLANYSVKIIGVTTPIRLTDGRNHVVTVNAQ